MRRKNDFTAGIEAILNNPKFDNPRTFSELVKHSGMPADQMLHYIGRNSQNQKVKPPSDKEISEQKLKTLQMKTESEK